MKRMLMMVAMVGAVTGAFAQGAPPTTAAEATGPYTNDMIYTTSGAMVRGEIVAQKPGEVYVIRTRDGAEYRYSASSVRTVVNKSHGQNTTYGATAETAATTATATRVATPVTPVTPTRGKKSAAAAFALSFFVWPGVGQWYNGDAGKGAAHFVIFGAGLGIALGGLSMTETVQVNRRIAGYDSYSSEKQVTGTGLAVAGIGVAVMFGTWLGSSIDAPVRAKRLNRENGYTRLPVREPRLYAGLDLARGGVNIGYRF